MTEFNGLLQHPFSMLIVGTTNSGKTVFTSKLLRSNIIQHKPPQIVYCYRMWNKLFDSLHGIQFIKGLNKLLEIVDELENCVIVLDDVATEAATSKHVATMFTAGMHHRNISVILIAHNLYMQAKYMREIMLNASYLVIFRNVRDSGQLKILERQTGIKGLYKAYEKCTKEKFNPLLIDLLPYTPDYARLRSHLFDKHQYIYVDDDELQ